LKILIVTPNEPFYLADNIKFLITNLSCNDQLIGCVLLKPTPYGKRITFFQKAFRTFKIFGFKFFIYYTIKYIYSKLFVVDVERILIKSKIPIIQLSKNINSNESLSILKELNPDLIISILGNEIFKRPILELPKNGCLNLHTSKLPKYRGMMPTFWAMLNDEKEIGISVFLMDEGIDTGPIISQATTPINPKDSQKNIIQRTKRIGMELIIESIEKIKTNSVQFIENENQESSYFTYPKKEDVKLFLKKGKKFF